MPIPSNQMRTERKSQTKNEIVQYEWEDTHTEIIRQFEKKRNKRRRKIEKQGEKQWIKTINPLNKVAGSS